MQILALPGINTVTSSFLCKLVEMSARHGWDPNGIALTISEESKFNPAIKNPDPRSTASGLIQFIEPTAASLGTTTAAIRAMSAEEQLPLVERFFETSLRGKIPERIEDYFLSVLGKPNLIGAPDNTTVFVKGSGGYEGNKQIDLDGNGVITVGNTRSYMQRVLNQARGTVPTICYESVTPPLVAPKAGLAAVTVGALALVVAAGYAAYKAFAVQAPEPEQIPVSFRRRFP